MARTASRSHHGPEQGMWFFILIAVIFVLAFVGVALLVPR